MAVERFPAAEFLVENGTAPPSVLFPGRSLAPRGDLYGCPECNEEFTLESETTHLCGCGKSWLRRGDELTVAGRIEE